MPHIVRVEGKKSTGWQVRLSTGQPRKYQSKLFSDRPHGGPEQARAAAEAWLNEHRGEDRPAVRAGTDTLYKTTLPSHNTSGVLGVYRTHNYQGTPPFEKQEYWGAFCSRGPNGGRYHRKFYINGERDEEEAFRLAVEFRRMWEEAAGQGEAALRRFWAEVESGWL